MRSTVISLITAFCAVAGFLSQVAIARAFGAGVMLDAYLIAASAPAVLAGLTAAILSYSLTPELTALSRQPERFAALASDLFWYVAIGVVAMAGIGALLSDRLTSVLAAPLQQNLRLEVAFMMRISWLGFAMASMNAYLVCVLSAQERFYWAAAAGAFPAFGTILATQFLAAEWGPFALAAGNATGTGVALGISLCRTVPVISLRLPKGPHAVEYLHRLPLVAAAMSCFTSYPLFDAFWAPMAGAGSLAYLGYSQRLLIAAGNLVVAGPAALLAPRLATAPSDEDMRRYLLDALKTTISWGAWAGAVLSALSRPIVEILFQRGSFGVAATDGVSGILPIMFTGMAPMLGVIILFRGMFQLKMVTTAAALGLGLTVIYGILSGVLSGRFGVTGIALAFTTSWATLLACGVVAVTPRGQRPGILCEFFTCVAACAVAGVMGAFVCYRLEELFGGAGCLILRLSKMAISGAGGTLAYVAAYKVLLRIGSRRNAVEKG